MNRKYRNTILSALLVSGFAAASVASAQITSPIGDDAGAVLSKAISVLEGALTGLGTIAIVVAGILFVLSAGNPKLAETAKSALFWGCMGILLGLIAGAVAAQVKSTTGGASDITAVIANIGTALSGILTGLGTVMVMIAGIFYVFSFGDPARVKTARTALIYAVVGIAIGLAMQAIISFVTGIAKGP